MMVFQSEAPKYYEKGLSPLPILKKQKRPAITQWQHFCIKQPSKEEFQSWLIKYKDFGIGLALGTKITEEFQLVAVDVDSDDLVPTVTHVLEKEGPSKKGKKGVTIFVLSPFNIKNTKIKRLTPEGKIDTRPSVEILAEGSQTVIPPTIHPEGMAYKWIGPSLDKIDLQSLPILDQFKLDEIISHCSGKGSHFKDLNDMVWKGVGGGGNTHDVCVTAVACMVSRGWDDNSIRDRIHRAKKEACERSDSKYEWPQANRTIQEWIDSAKTKGMDSKNVKKVPPERLMAEWSLGYLGGKDVVKCVQSKLRQYKNGYWPEVNVPELIKTMYEFDQNLRERDAKAATSILHTMTNDLSFNESPQQKICLLNGTLNIRTGRLEQWSPDDELLHQLNFEWDDDARCPLYDKVIKQTFNQDRDTIWLWDEFCAYTLINDIAFQRVLFLKGSGGNGKGTIARVLRNMHNPAAVGSVAITDLKDERKRTSLVGKFVNISGEQSRLNVVSDTYLKKITGGDPIDIRKLYGEVQNNVVLSVRFLELVNEMPATSDSSYALKRRIIILDCPNKVEEPDFNLDKKLIKERPGVLRRWVQALKRLYERGDFYVPEKSKTLVQEYMIENDPIEYWFKERTEPVPKIEKMTPSRDLYADFRSWAQEMGYKYTPPEVVWGKKLTELGFPTNNIRISKGTVKGRRLKIREGMEGNI